MLFYSLKWTPKKSNSSKNLNRLTVVIKGVNSTGATVTLEKEYEQWLGVCTNNIEKTISEIRYCFPGINITYEILENRQYQKVLPNFSKRLFEKKPLKKNFYKLYSSNAYISDIGVVLDKYKISYYRPEDWLVTLYVDLCLESFYYSWYNVGNSQMLLQSMQLNLEYGENPSIYIVAFDLETVATDNSNRFASGHDENDQIVTISLVKWNYRYEIAEKCLLYLNPLSDSVNCKLQKLPDVEYLEFFSEQELLKAFHATISHCHLLTGYNINNFAIPCLLARLILLCNMEDNLKMYSSKRIGTHIITTIQNKIILDMYNFIQNFSNQNLTSVHLKDVAQSKLNRSAQPVETTSSLHYYYANPINTTDILLSSDKKYVYDYLKPKRLDIFEFGTFSECLNICMENSVLIHLLFNHELTLPFLIERANLCAMDVQSALYLSNSRYILSMFLTAGIRLGFFLNIGYFHNSVAEDHMKYRDILVHRKNKSHTYQGGLNFSIPGTFYKNVTVLDFLSMYSSIIVNQNLSYETSGLVELDTFLNLSDDIKKQCIVVPYSQHLENEILLDNHVHSGLYAFPEIDIKKHRFLMVSYKGERGFLPSILDEFLEKRKALQKQYKENRDPILHVRQQNIKFLLNSISGCLGSENFCMRYIDISAMTACYSRIFLLGASQFAQHKLRCNTVYADTDSIFVLEYEHGNCDIINNYLNQKSMVLRLEKKLSCLLIISKKRYIFREKNNDDNCKLVGFEEKANSVSKWMSNYIASKVVWAIEHNQRSASHGWVTWTNALIQVFAMCSYPKAFYLTHKTPNPSTNETYLRADVSKSASEKMISSLHDNCKEINFEKLFINQKKLLIHLLNVAFFNLHDSAVLMQPCNKVLNTMTWRRFLNADFICLKKFKKPILILVLKSVKYSFDINE